MSALILVMPSAGAEFYVWRDSLGRKHASTVPRSGLLAGGRLRAVNDQRSLAFQHRELRKAMARRAAASLAALKRPVSIAATPVPARSLDELIALEKRASRAAAHDGPWPLTCAIP